MKVEHINPFIDSTVNVISTMTGHTPTRGKLSLKAETVLAFDVSAIIGIAGDVHGSVVISFPQDVALKVVSSFIGETKDVLDDDVQDAVGEFVNMIAGGAKKNLMGTGLRFKLSIPNIVVGAGHKVTRPKNVPCILVPFHIDDVGDFAVEVSLKEVAP